MLIKRNEWRLGDLKLINVCVNLFFDFLNGKRISRFYFKFIFCYFIYGKIYLLIN